MSVSPNSAFRTYRDHWWLPVWHPFSLTDWLTNNWLVIFRYLALPQTAMCVSNSSPPAATLAPEGHPNGPRTVSFSLPTFGSRTGCVLLKDTGVRICWGDSGGNILTPKRELKVKRSYVLPLGILLSFYNAWNFSEHLPYSLRMQPAWVRKQEREMEKSEMW